MESSRSFENRGMRATEEVMCTLRSSRTPLGARFDTHHTHFYPPLQSLYDNFGSLRFPASLGSGIAIMEAAGAGSQVNSVYAAEFTTDAADEGTPCKRCRKVLRKDELFFVQDSRVLIRNVGNLLRPRPCSGPQEGWRRARARHAWTTALNAYCKAPTWIA